MTNESTQTGVPKLDAPIVNPDGTVSIPWYRFWIALWNRTGKSSGSPSLILDSISSTIGSLLYRGTTEWTGLGPSTAGEVLATGGPGNAPSWVDRVSQIDTGEGLQGGPITKTGQISLAQAPAQTLKGNVDVHAEIPTDLTPAQVKTILNFIASGDAAGGVLSGTYPDPGMGANVVGNSNLAQVPEQTLKGNAGVATADPSDLTVAQVLQMLGLGVAPGQPNFFAYLETTTAVTSGVETLVPFEITRFNQGGYFDTSTHRFTPLVAGTYFVSATLYCQASPLVDAAVLINKSGTDVASVGNSMTSGSIQISYLVQMNGSTDYLEIWGLLDGTTPEFLFVGDTRAVTFFQAYRVGP